MIRIIQHREKCIGCNACDEAADYRWRISRKDGKCTLVGATEKRGFHTIIVDDHELEDIVLAKTNCPVNIITIVKM
jgi:ferredoxin